MLRRGWVRSEWRSSDNNRRARYYAITREGERQLAAERAEWGRSSGAVTVQHATRPFARRVAAHASRAFGRLERYKDEMRDERGASWFDALRQDLHFAWVSLRRRSGFTSLVVLTLALGIGATTTLFGVVKAVLLTPLPYGQPEGIAVLWSAWKGFPQTWLSYDEYEAWQTQIRSFADVGLFSDGSITLSDGDESERVRYGQVGANVFPILGVSPILGRGFTAEEDRPNGPRVIALGYDLWQRRYGGDASILGRIIQVNGAAAAVVGVMPAGFQLPLDFGSDGLPRHGCQLLRRLN